MLEQLARQLQGLKVLILGFGKEGKSTYKLLSKITGPQNLFIADINPDAVKELSANEGIHPHLITGESYLKDLDRFDLIIKTPGIQRSILRDRVPPERITSQTDLFMKAFNRQIIGITGTKGKSTTTTLLSRIIEAHTQNVVMVGNIGLPPFDLMERINPETHIVYELSAHQLDDVSNSPHIAILLNIFEEHLDHYPSMELYRKAKYRIASFQDKNDWLILNGDDAGLEEFSAQLNPSPKIVRFSIQQQKGDGMFGHSDETIRIRVKNEVSNMDVGNRIALKGEHNLKNIMAAVGAAKILDIPDMTIQNVILKFEGLEHRMEHIGNFGGIEFYNDSIATIPEATMAALKTLPDVDTLILGGRDRGIDYSELTKYLAGSSIRNFIFTGKAGERIMAGLKPLKKPGQNFFPIGHFAEMAVIIRKETLPGKICLLSPAASSYDQFRNFEERGNLFKKIAQSISLPQE
jgi:UDP-N-acetylmuramoyl-L-alanine---L-glutamate ligase